MISLMAYKAFLKRQSADQFRVVRTRNGISKQCFASFYTAIRSNFIPAAVIKLSNFFPVKCYANIFFLLSTYQQIYDIPYVY